MKILIIDRSNRGAKFWVVDKGTFQKKEDPILRMFLNESIKKKIMCVGEYIPTTIENGDIKLVCVKNKDSKLHYFVPKVVVTPYSIKRAVVEVTKPTLAQYALTKADPIPTVLDKTLRFGKRMFSAGILSLALIKSLFPQEKHDAHKISMLVQKMGIDESTRFWKEYMKLKPRRKVRDMLDAVVDEDYKTRTVKHTHSNFDGYKQGQFRFKGHEGHIDKTPEITWLTNNFGQPHYFLTLKSVHDKPATRYVIFKTPTKLVLEAEYRKLKTIVLPISYERKLKITVDSAIAIESIVELQKGGITIRHDYKDKTRAHWKKNVLAAVKT